MDAEVKSYEYEYSATNAAGEGRLKRKMKGKLVTSHMSRIRLWSKSYFVVLRSMEVEERALI